MTDLFGNADDQTPATPATATGVELADWLGITPSAVTRLKQAGRVVPAPAGGYLLKASIQKYVGGMRKSDERGSPRDLDQQKKFWDVENAKQKNYRWRMDYGRELIQAYARAHRGSLEQFRKRLESGENPILAALDLAAEIDTTATDEILADVTDEGGEFADQD
jgi:hypothetical protein